MPATRGRSRTADRSPVPGKPRNDVYTGLLIISLLAMLFGTVVLYLDYSAYPTSKAPQLPPRQTASPLPPGGGAAGQPPPAPAPPGPGQGAPPVPPPGGGAQGNPGGPPGGVAPPANPPMPPGGGGGAPPE